MITDSKKEAVYFFRDLQLPVFSFFSFNHDDTRKYARKFVDHRKKIGLPNFPQAEVHYLSGSRQNDASTFDLVLVRKYHDKNGEEAYELCVGRDWQNPGHRSDVLQIEDIEVISVLDKHRIIVRDHPSERSSRISRLFSKVAAYVI